MKTATVLALLAVATAAVAATPHQIQSNNQQAANIQSHSTLALDPVVLDKAVLKAYNNLWHIVSYFFYRAKVAVHNGEAEFIIIQHHNNFLEGSQTRYKQFREVVYSGDEDLSRTYGDIAARFGKLWAEEAIFETTRTAKQYSPEVLEQIQEYGRQTYSNVTTEFEPVFELLKPEQPNELQQATNIQARSLLALDPVVLDEAVLKAYNNLWHTVSYFFHLAKVAVHNGEAEFIIIQHHYNFMEGSQTRYKQFREVVYSGDEDLSRTYGEIAARFGNLWAEEAIFETTRTVKQYTPEVLEQIQENGRQTYANVTAGFEPVFELLKPENQ